jgi:hypothetical protein
MVEEPDEKLRAGRRGVFYATLLLALPFLYVASLGPAAVIHNHGGPTTKRVIERVYFPLEFFAVNTGTEKYFSQYVDWWESLGGGPWESSIVGALSPKVDLIRCPLMQAAKPSRYRWLRFSLRGFLIAVTLFSVVVGDGLRVRRSSDVR